MAIVDRGPLEATRLLERLLAAGAAAEVALRWVELCALLGRGRSAREPSRNEVERELDALHHRDQAALLRDASAFRVATRRAEADWLGSPALGIPGEDRTTLAGWRRRLLEEMRIAREDGVEVPYLLAACALWHPRVWGEESARELARASLELEECADGHLALARALVAEGEPAAALDELARLRPRDFVDDRDAFGATAELCRGAALERLGDLAGARAAFDRVAARADSDAYLTALVLALALGCGEAVAARRAAAWLAALGAEGEVGGLDLLRDRVERWDRRAFAASEDCQALVFELLCGDDPVALEVGFAFLH